MNFDYQIFYDYYTNRHQIYPDIFKYNQIPISANYFHYSKSQGYTLQISSLSGPYITYNNQDIFITLLPNTNQFLFNIVRFDTITNKNWNDHFHIGFNNNYDNVYRKNTKQDIIFFQFSYQNISKGEKEIIMKCNFRNRNEDINNIESIYCTNKSVPTTMQQTFNSYLSIVKHILRRPFFPLNQVGGNKHFIKTSNMYKCKDGILRRLYNKEVIFYVKMKNKNGKMKFRKVLNYKHE